MSKYLGFIDYNDDFEKDEVVNCHWWNKPSFSRHYHNYYEIFVVFEGKTLHILNDEEQEIQTRHTYIIRPSDVHQAVQIGKEQCLHFNIAVTQQVFKCACDFLHEDLFEKINNAEKISFVLSNKEFGYFNFLANKIHTIDPTLPNKKDIIALYGKQLLTYTLSLYEEKTKIKKEYPQWFEDLLQKINSPKYIDCKISDIYQMSNYSAPNLIRFFKLYTGKTITKYLQVAKVHYDCNLLETTDLSTLQIASKIGYDSLSHFNTLFKKLTGYTPFEYKKQPRNDLLNNRTDVDI